MIVVFKNVYVTKVNHPVQNYRVVQWFIRRPQHAREDKQNIWLHKLYSHPLFFPAGFQMNLKKDIVDLMSHIKGTYLLTN